MGGVSACEVTFTVLAKTPLTPPNPCMARQHPRDVSTVLTGQYTPHVWSGPAQSVVEPLVAALAATHGCVPVWHGRVLLPAHWSPAMWITVPAQPPRGSQWGIRKLSLLECWLSADVSERHEVLPWPSTWFVPARCWGGVLFLLGYGGVCFFHRFHPS